MPISVLGLLLGLLMLPGCERKDSAARRYIRDSLDPYLDSVAYQLCEIKYLVAATAPGRSVCTGPPEGYKKPPSNGAP